MHDVQLRALLLELAPRRTAKIVAGKHKPRKVVTSAHGYQ